MEKIIIYTGLTIPFDEAREILDSNENREVIYKRPIKRGDLGHDLNENPTIIGIIDGVFHQNSAVGHREILSALNKGIKVFGSSSMGALRASELDTLGMTGIGYVYNEYASGNVTSDDDVAVMLDSESLEPLSEPLINMNYVFKKAFSANIITESEKNELMKISKETFYPKRTYAQTLSKSSLDNDKKSELIDLIRTTPDMKKEDAKQLLEHIHLISNE
ncbi:MAG: TfuA-related McrA-glycine thioamidation protein [Methanobrevibacter sp.]|nr:TfuA-related McrA-glycine thioamidation protein [Methanobrevibacter sp.]